MTTQPPGLNGEGGTVSQIITLDNMDQIWEGWGEGGGCLWLLTHGTKALVSGAQNKIIYCSHYVLVF